MTRWITTRFDSTCYDCGSPIPKGTRVRWFGKGRVSCCGKRGNASPPSRDPDTSVSTSNPFAGSFGDAPQPTAAPAPRSDAEVLREQLRVAETALGRSETEREQLDRQLADLRRAHDHAQTLGDDGPDLPESMQSNSPRWVRLAYRMAVHDDPIEAARWGATLARELSVFADRALGL
jgi:hypothetical protein